MRSMIYDRVKTVRRTVTPEDIMHKPDFLDGAQTTRGYSSSVARERDAGSAYNNGRWPNSFDKRSRTFWPPTLRCTI